jgi:hypothetical protein
MRNRNHALSMGLKHGVFMTSRGATIESTFVARRDRKNYLEPFPAHAM